MDLPLSPDALEGAIDGGLRFLQHDQRPSGEFPTITSPHLDMTASIDCPMVIYVTTFVVHVLASPYFARRSSAPQVQAMLERAGAFLLSEQCESGAWGFEGRSTIRIPYDLDDTSCAVAALLELGHPRSPAFYRLLWQNEVAPGGPYYTWIGMNQGEDSAFAREVDALVNANILFCGGLLGLSLPAVAAYLRAII